MSKSKNWQIIGASLVALVVLGLSGWFIFALAQTGVGFQSGVLGLIGVATAGIMAHRSATRRDIAARHFETKRAAYTGFIDLTFEMIMADKLNKKTLTEQELMSKIVNFKKDLLTWADADVIKTWMDIEVSNLEKPSEDNPAETLLVWDRLLRAIRKDLGKDDSKLKAGDLVALFLNAEGRSDLEKTRSA